MNIETGQHLIPTPLHPKEFLVWLTVLGDPNVPYNPAVPEMYGYGICGSAHLSGINIGWLKDQFLEWPEYSGSDDFPVPYREDGDLQVERAAERAFYQTSKVFKWSGASEYGRSRRRLCWFLKQRMERNKFSTRLYDSGTTWEGNYTQFACVTRDSDIFQRRLQSHQRVFELY